MAALFPEGPQISSTEDECKDYLFSHMTAVETDSEQFNWTSDWEFCGITVDSNSGKIYVIEGNAHITIFSETLEFLKAFTLQNIISPWGIVIHNDSLYMTDILRHSVFHFKLTGESLVFINEEGGEYGSDIGYYNKPRQLDVSINGYIYVSDCLNHRIKVLDEDLYYIRQISHRSMTRPIDVKLTPYEVYVLSDSNTYSIHVFSHFGDKIQSLIPRESGTRAQVESSRFFSLDSRGNFVIGDSFSDLQVFSKEGKFIHTLGTHELGLYSFRFYPPLCVAVQTVNGKLLVVSKENYRPSKIVTNCGCTEYVGVRVRLFSL